MVERSADWINQAEGDLEHAKHDLKFGFYDWACFSAQQSAEKAVKAALQKLGAEVWGHSVYDLLTHLNEKEPISTTLLEYSLELDKAYIPIRYPNAHPSSSPRRRYTGGEAERLIKYAEEILEFCKSLLSKV
ncbi:MAG: HEPN domain-containing protein [Thermoproteota archaeon]|nr:HEPN domain-containing protein [Candidatus Brockarchaeota archaeon]